MLVCPVCFEYSFKSISSYLSHIRLIHADSPNFRVNCGLQNCSRTFKNFRTYQNHIYNFHKDVLKDKTSEIPVDLDSSMDIATNSSPFNQSVIDSPTIDDHILMKEDEDNNHCELL